MKHRINEILKKNQREKIIEKIDDKIGEIVGEELEFFKSLKNFIIFSGGKRIRPLVHYYFSKLLNYHDEESIDIGAIGELIHAASLLHDDVIDNSDKRRGKPTFHTLYGNKRTILAGDYLLSCGIDHLRKLKKGFHLLPIFTRVIRNLATAEILQMENERKPEITEKIFEKIIIGKTADLFACMTEAAAIIANQLDKQKLFHNIGLQMGIVFQIRDDYLDYFSTKEELGKDLYLDYSRGLITYPLLVLKKYITEKEKQALFSNWEDNEKRNANLEFLLSLFTKYQIRKSIAEEIKNKINEIIAFVKNIDTNYKDEKNKILDTLEKLKV